MSNKSIDTKLPVDGFRNEATRQRWDLFHRAIAQAKRSNVEALQAEQDAGHEATSSPLRPVGT